jgi:hypothetical protein
MKEVSMMVSFGGGSERNRERKRFKAARAFLKNFDTHDISLFEPQQNFKR